MILILEPNQRFAHLALGEERLRHCSLRRCLQRMGFYDPESLLPPYRSLTSECADDIDDEEVESP